MLLIVGLGNPGSEHARQRHNVGFMAVDAIQGEHGFSPWKVKFQGMFSEGKLGTDKVLLLKPNTYMNNSGQAVREAAAFYKLDPADIVVLYDELDLAPGKVRIKTGGGAGGHNGIRSMDAHLPSKDYRRVRIGIGHPGHKDRVTGHVLGNFREEDRLWLDPLLDQIARHAELLAKGEDAQFLNRIAMNADNTEPTGARGADSKNKRGIKPTPQSKGQSHVRQARTKKPDAPATGPMAAMLKKLLGD